MPLSPLPVLTGSDPPLLTLVELGLDRIDFVDFQYRPSRAPVRQALEEGARAPFFNPGMQKLVDGFTGCRGNAYVSFANPARLVRLALRVFMRQAVATSLAVKGH